MHFSTNLIAFVAASLVTSSIAAPVENTTLVDQGRPSTPPAPLKCTDPKTGTSAKCWTEVKVDEYMEEWHRKNFPAQCKSSDWSTCFNVFAKPGNGLQNCTAIDSEQCQQLNPRQHFLSPQWYYGSYNSWWLTKFQQHPAINKFFSGWSNAIKQVDAINPYVIHNASKPQGVDEFLAAKTTDKTISIDLVLNNLITRAPSDPQNDAVPRRPQNLQTQLVHSRRPNQLREARHASSRPAADAFGRQN
ncbi:MAG: hypothetical protein L6R42_007409 [Xanthoria sp. 1 TBL-2021]|nr:MAG: hypothetical protein L6R42_007409 [Xanthoria sp. 1 TBL-2021]